MPLKKCKQCGLDKPYTDFHRTGRNNRCLGGVRACCKVCINSNNRKHWPFYYTDNQTLIRERRKKRYAVIRPYSLRKRYAMDIIKYDELLESQHGVCAICGSSETKTRNGKTLQLCVDHNHKTQTIRGLLCSSCNLGVGNLIDTTTKADSLIKYIQKWAGK